MVFSRQEYQSGLPGPQGVAISNTWYQLGHIFVFKKKKGIDPEIILAPGCLTGLQGIKGTEEQIEEHYKAASIPVQIVGHPTREMIHYLQQTKCKMKLLKGAGTVTEQKGPSKEMCQTR